MDGYRASSMPSQLDGPASARVGGAVAVSMEALKSLAARLPAPGGDFVPHAARFASFVFTTSRAGETVAASPCPSISVPMLGVRMTPGIGHGPQSRDGSRRRGLAPDVAQGETPGVQAAANKGRCHDSQSTHSAV